MRSQIICPVSFCLHPDCKQSVRARWWVIYSLSGLEVLSLWIIQTVVNRWMNNSSWIESIVLLMICRISNGCRRKCCNWSHESDYIISLDTTHTCTHVCAVCGAALESKKPEGLSLAVHHNMMRQHIAGQVVFLHTRMGCVWLIKHIHLLAVMFPWC